ncbi:hypothetical protein AAFN88_08675 [Pelagibius sp. CAU 1746]|uniref:hypothetical protein n=1 Tax=Pelagibius sp. CAU 1746 TaxID=3140370 RepID=UPI00325C2E89
MQALKALVIFMGILIMAGMALLVYGLVTRTGDGAGEGAGETATGAAAVGAMTGAGRGGAGAPITPFGALDLVVPDGCSLAGSELAGDRLVVRFTGQAERGCQQLVIVDLASGRELGRVKAVPVGARQAP